MDGGKKPEQKMEGASAVSGSAAFRKEADQRPPYGKLRCRGKGDRRKARKKAIHSTEHALVSGTLELACLPSAPRGPQRVTFPVISPHIKSV